MRALLVMAWLSIAIGCFSLPCHAGSATEPSNDSYYNAEYRFGFRLDRHAGIATTTLSNSPLYRIGQEMLRYQMIGSHDFIGEQIFKDGKFHRVAGKFLTDGSISMRSAEPGVSEFEWVMQPVRDIGSSESTNSSSADVDRAPAAALTPASRPQSDNMEFWRWIFVGLFVVQGCWNGRLFGGIMLAAMTYFLFPMVYGLWAIHEAVTDMLSGGH